MNLENQTSVSAWADRTFGPAGSNLSVAVRANQEMAELLSKLAADDNDPAAIEECADVVIILMRLCDRNGRNLALAIDQKMAVNRARRWRLDGHGHGHHVADQMPTLPDRSEDCDRSDLVRVAEYNVAHTKPKPAATP